VGRKGALLAVVQAHKHHNWPTNGYTTPTDVTPKWPKCRAKTSFFRPLWGDFLTQNFLESMRKFRKVFVKLARSFQFFTVFYKFLLNHIVETGINILVGLSDVNALVISTPNSCLFASVGPTLPSSLE
jgi:hypothetical protein